MIMKTTGYILAGILLVMSAFGAEAQGVSGHRLEERVAALNAGGPAGRKAGSPEGEAAAEYIASVFEEAGLFPYYAGQYVDEFSADPLVGSARKTYRNVAGIIYGSSYELDGEYIIIGAHYDFAGTGGDSSNTVTEDNTSGVAALLELAFTLKECSPGRNIVLVAFDGFEQGLLGSRRFVEESSLTADNILMMVNLSRIGRMPYADISLRVSHTAIGIEEGSEREMLTFFTEGATEKQTNYFLKTDNPLGIRTDSNGYKGRTDAEPFREAGVPALHVTVTAYGEQRDSGPEQVNTAALAEITELLADGICSLSKDASIKASSENTKAKKKRGPRFEGGVSILAGSSFFKETDGDMRGKVMFSGGAGVYGQVNFAGFLGLRPEVQYIHSGSRLEGYNYRMNSIFIPVSLVVQTPPYLAGSPQLLVGGYYRRTFNCTGGFDEQSTGGDVIYTPAMFQNGAGLHWGINLRLKSFGIGVTTRYGITDLYRGTGGNMRERATYGTVSYNF